MSSSTIRRGVTLLAASAMLTGGAVVGGTTAQSAPVAPARISASPVSSTLVSSAPVSAAQVALAPRAAARTLRVGSRGPAVTALQSRLNALGYSLGRVDGVYAARTRQAVMALQKVAGLPRTGVADARTQAAASKGIRPAARSRSGHVIEIDKARQTLYVVDGGRVSRIYNVSTGNNKRYRDRGRWVRAVTPSGGFRFWTQYGDGSGWQHGRLGSMYRPMYFNGGIAVHGSRFDIGAYPSSHGCVRIHNANMDELRGQRLIGLRGSVVVY
ncbi:peptidoglycan-binding protein [Arsenicicoccus cauae]|uniref:L,D-transpeptidase family protein n=1 Tax=Arsenicicoccus cauae TaxID=2663847 RepID=A0A6I3IH02_9MICO|nr:L,D-transpeptidase family protein [Arsenicicoccus cauae]MTB73372.1 L,D-transpeptidase family protein [Arsenicicoccus cauae]